MYTTELKYNHFKVQRKYYVVERAVEETAFRFCPTKFASLVPTVNKSFVFKAYSCRSTTCRGLYGSQNAEWSKLVFICSWLSQRNREATLSVQVHQAQYCISDKVYGEDKLLSFTVLSFLCWLDNRIICKLLFISLKGIISISNSVVKPGFLRYVLPSFWCCEVRPNQSISWAGVATLLCFIDSLLFSNSWKCAADY